MANRNIPAELRHGEPPGSPGEWMADDWSKMGFTVLEHEGDPPRAVWLRCHDCRAHVHASGAHKHKQKRCVVRHPDGGHPYA